MYKKIQNAVDLINKHLVSMVIMSIYTVQLSMRACISYQILTLKKEQKYANMAVNKSTNETRRLFISPTQLVDK